jgi:hypothetical protein
MKFESEEVNDWTPGAVKQRENSVLISLFGNIRKSSKELQNEALDNAGFTTQSYSDSEGNTYYVKDLGAPLQEWEEIEKEAEERANGTYTGPVRKKKGKYDSVEKGKFVKNIMDLKAKGFYVQDGNIYFPYIIKVTELDDDGKSTRRVPYILKAVGKRGVSKKGEGANLSSLVQPADFAEGNYAISGVEAVYIPFEYKGSKKTFKAGFVFDEIPALAQKPRTKFLKNNAPTDQNYWDKIAEESEYRELTPEEEALASIQAAGVDISQPAQPKTIIKKPGESRTPKDILFEDYGISFEFSNKGFKFSGAKYEKLVNDTGVLYSNPQELLKALGYETSENKISDEDKTNPLEDKCAQPAATPKSGLVAASKSVLDDFANNFGN